MGADIRKAMIDSAWMMISERGVEGMSVLEVLRRTNAPRGSVQHYFPGGRAELIAEAIGRSRTWMAEQVGAIEPKSASNIVHQFLGIWRRVLQASDFQAGCAAAGLITGSTTSEQLAAGAAAFEDSLASLTRQFESLGVSAAESRSRATVLVSAAEGTVLIARSQRSLDSLSIVAEQLARDWDLTDEHRKG